MGELANSIRSGFKITPMLEFPSSTLSKPRVCTRALVWSGPAGLWETHEQEESGTDLSMLPRDSNHLKPCRTPNRASLDTTSDNDQEKSSNSVKLWAYTQAKT